jgi:hypothetical protein
MNDQNPVSASPSSGDEGGEVGEDCLSGECNLNRLRFRSYEPRVPQPPTELSSAGKSEGLAQSGLLSLLTFLADAKKVSSRRATPGTGIRNKNTQALCEDIRLPPAREQVVRSNAA